MIDWGRILSAFLYDPARPMVFHSGLFMYSLLILLALWSLVQDKGRWRISVLLGYSLWFYWKSSGAFVLLLCTTAFIDWGLSRLMALSKRRALRALLLILSLAANLGILAWFKYANFLIGNWNALAGLDFLRLPPLASVSVILPVGISFYTFQSLSYTIDVFRGEILPLRRYDDYLFYVSFFPQLVAGPIVRAKDFIHQIHRPVVTTKEDIGRGVALIACGLVKKVVIADYIASNFVDRVFDSPALYTGAENLLSVYGYALQIFCDFSGYSDMAIGLALLLGFRLMKNFDSPYRSATLTDFWRRWHISLSTWLKDYLYVPLGGNRKGKARQYANLMVTMLLGGLWHGADWKFVAWGGLHGAGLAAEKALHGGRGPRRKVLRILHGILVFNFVCLAWIFFRAADFGQALLVLKRIFTDFRPSVLLRFPSGYPMVLSLMALGFLSQLLPPSWKEGAKGLLAKSPYPVQALSLALAVWLAFQFQSADVQPFIYFQF